MFLLTDKYDIKDSDSFIHITPKENLKGILGLSSDKELDDVLAQIAKNKIHRKIHLKSSKGIFKNLTAGFCRDGYTYFFRNNISDFSMFLNLCGRHQHFKNVKITIPAYAMKGMLSTVQYRRIDGTIMLEGDYRGDAIIERVI
ncbi:hypothetical protein VP018_001829 [Morganella morganii]|uniref:hypothetical protein n=1 Tax=Morganella morganii TaxID=582 RepID=UPI0003A92A64|nr:hypothetical protein [Morganella morganii]EMD0830011.1 hypothetical protein [Morganella morganii]MBS5192606.1 hypothetical protein [Morganella morganii]MBT0383975.1 hypothetical protein [Morganella morganii subsp. morganii]HDU8583960.1 hypothetical protein [Morganella morganii]